jgi:hypothetical protein
VTQRDTLVVLIESVVIPREARDLGSCSRRRCRCRAQPLAPSQGAPSDHRVKPTSRERGRHACSPLACGGKYAYRAPRFSSREPAPPATRRRATLDAPHVGISLCAGQRHRRCFTRDSALDTRVDRQLSSAFVPLASNFYLYRFFSRTVQRFGITRHLDRLLGGPALPRTSIGPGTPCRNARFHIGVKLVSYQGTACAMPSGPRSIWVFWLLRFWFPLRSTTYKNSSNA